MEQIFFFYQVEMLRISVSLTKIDTSLTFFFSAGIMRSVASVGEMAADV